MAVLAVLNDAGDHLVTYPRGEHHITRMPEQPDRRHPEVVPLGSNYPFAAQRERNAQLKQQAERIALSISAPARELSIPLAMVPANTRDLSPLPPDSRHTFLGRLEATIRRVFVTATPELVNKVDPLAPDVSESPARVTLDSSATTAVLGRSCATCRGKCCTSGGNHAFLRDETIERVHREQPSLDMSAILAVYANHLPKHHFAGSCVYHASDGCGLPRTLRSDLCNRYECGGLTQLRSAVSGRENPSAFVAAADAHVLRRMALVDASETRPVALN